MTPVASSVKKESKMKMQAPKVVLIEDLCKLPSGISLIEPALWRVFDMDGDELWCLRVSINDGQVTRKSFFRCDTMEYVCEADDYDQGDD